MRLTYLAELITVATIGISIASVGTTHAQQPKTTIKEEPIKATTASSGAEMYSQYCAACHGPTGKGNGPAVAALKTAPPDLTLLAKRNNGQFPEMHVMQVLKGGPDWPAHGSAEMPTWGPLFSAVSSSQSIVQLRVSNVTKYLESMQAK